MRAGTVSDRAHARDLAEMDRERKRRDARTPRAIEVLELANKLYVWQCSNSGSRHPDAVDIMTLSDLLLDEVSSGRDIPEEIAVALLGLLNACSARPEKAGKEKAMSTMIVEVPAAESPRGLTALQGGAGRLALALMPEAEFAQRLAALKTGQERIRQIKHTLMTEGVHYGTIPGTDKPTLLKPGAEVLCDAYGLRADFVPRVEYGDGESAPAIRVSGRCELHQGDMRGPVVAVGVSAANSWERKHRYRRGERSCPECGTVGSVIKGKANFGGGWLCWAKKGGCGAKWPDGSAEIEQQAVGDVENPDQQDLENTLVKMAKKRALIDAALTGTASSDLFTQDLDEQEHAAEPAKPTKPAAPPTRTQAPAPDPEYPSDPEAYERHDVEPASKPAPGELPACPAGHSGARVMVSKVPSKGKYFCKACGTGYGAKG